MSSVNMTRPSPAVSPVRLRGAPDLMDGADVFIFDCDGVIWKGDTLIPEAAAALDTLRRRGKRLFFITNNSTRTREGFRAKFTKLGVPVATEEIFSSSFAAALYLQQNPLPAHKNKVYVVGQEGISQELELAGIPSLGGAADSDKAGRQWGPGSMVETDPAVGAVVVGMDTDINYYKIQYAQLCVNAGALFVATNMDQTGHLSEKQVRSRTGASAMRCMCTG